MIERGIMSSRDAQSDAATDLLQRRRFAAMAAARFKQAECEALLKVMAIAKASRHESRVELCKLEVLRDGLHAELAEEMERQLLCEVISDAPAL
jgi:hypothetical protein